MLPTFPDLVKCEKCGSFLWLNRMAAWSERNGNLPQKEGSIKATPAQFLSIHEYFEALSSSACDSKEDIFDVRMAIWQAYNDRHREGKDMFRNSYDESLWLESAKALFDFLESGDINHQVMKAELYRNLGEFEKCMSIINELDEESYGWIKQAFKQECKKKNKLVFQFS
ncbi:MAG: hypothetical protein B7C24_12755 [Bacteroidetes bacterium 4572_77]|nr:MAG: hypothetical protein B7C24_12755 [Bacteroidetes bacterium 4572_77]